MPTVTAHEGLYMCLYRAFLVGTDKIIELEEVSDKEPAFNELNAENMDVKIRILSSV